MKINSKKLWASLAYAGVLASALSSAPAGAEPVVSGCRQPLTQSWCNTTCSYWVGNGNDGCINTSGGFVSRACICSDPANAKEALIDIEINLGITLDPLFKQNAGYQGTVPPIDPKITVADAKKWFVQLLGPTKGAQLASDLDTNHDGILFRSEASAAKGADPTQTLNTGFGSGLSTDDVLAYLGLYLGDGALDKYAGDLDASVKTNMLAVTRSWQPGVNAQACTYRGGCGGTDTAAPSVPGSVTVNSATSSSLRVNWSASSDNVGVTAYEVFRGATSVGTTAGLNFTDGGLAANTTYSYQVRARDAAGNWSAKSTTVSGTTSPGITNRARRCPARSS